LVKERAYNATEAVLEGASRVRAGKTVPTLLEAVDRNAYP